MSQTPQQADRDPQSPTQDADEKARLGTRILPVPEKAPVVAGMPRADRAVTDPGEPGIIRPEDDVYANDPADLSETTPSPAKPRP
jgi:hypothetical protein